MEQLFAKILNMSITASILVGVVLILRLVLKRAPYWLRCALWTMVALRLLVPFTVESSFSMVPDTVSNGEVVSELADDYVGTVHIYHDVSDAYQPAVDAGREPVSAGEGGHYVVTGEDGISAPSTVGNTVFPVLSKIWLVGMAIMAGYAICTYLRLRRKVGASVNVSENIHICDYIDTPFILGIVRPKIYLPSAMAQEAAAYVLAHERAHIRRCDHWWKPLGFALLTIHWFNPVLGLAYILLCRDIELACDEKVIREMGIAEKKAYSEALLSCSVPRHLIAACPLAFGEVGVKDRVKSVLNYKKPGFWIILLAVAVAIIAAACFLTDPVSKDEQTTGVVFQATVLRTAENSMLVAPDEGAMERNSSDMIWVSFAPDGIRAGDTVKIDYDGMIAETYPAQINTVYDVTVVKNVITDEILAQICAELGTDQISFFDYQVIGDYAVVGCECGGKTALVTLQEDNGMYVLIDIQGNYNGYYWIGSTTEILDYEFFVILDPEIPGVCIPGQEETSFIPVYNYPAVVVVETGCGYKPVMPDGVNAKPEDIYELLADSQHYMDGCMVTLSSEEFRPGRYNLREDEMQTLVTILQDIPEAALQPVDAIEYGFVIVMFYKYLGGEENIMVQIAYDGERVVMYYCEYEFMNEDSYIHQYWLIEDDKLADFLAGLYDPDRREGYFSSMAIPGNEPVTYSCGYANISVPYWDYWEYEIVEYTDDYSPFGIRFKPKEEEGWLMVGYWPSGYAVCGTGLELREYEIPGSTDRTATAGYYEGSDQWSFITIDGLAGSYVVVDEGASQWLDGYSAGFDDIIRHSGLGEGVPTEREILQMVKSVEYDDVRTVFDFRTGIWTVYLYDDKGGEIGVYTVSPRGNLTQIS